MGVEKCQERIVYKLSVSKRINGNLEGKNTGTSETRNIRLSGDILQQDWENARLRYEFECKIEVSWWGRRGADCGLGIQLCFKIRQNRILVNP